MRYTPAQDAAVSYVARHSGTLAIRVAEAIGPHGSRFYGYQTINRAVKNGRLKEGTCEDALCAPPNRQHRHLFIGVKK